MAARLRPGFALWLLVLVFSLAGVAFQVLGVDDAAQARSWPEADGRILTSELKPGCGKGGRELLPRIVYEYRARGLPFQGHRVALDTDFCGWPRDGQQVVQAYPPGLRVTVYYDPRAPHRSVLRQGAPQGRTTWTLLAFAALAAWSVGMMVAKVRPAETKRRRARR